MTTTPDLPEPGIYYDIPFNDYKAWPAVNNSSLNATMKSARHYQYEQTAARHDTPALKTGRLTHCVHLTPEVFAKEYAVIPVDEIEKAVLSASGEKPKNIKATKAYKQLVAEFLKEHEGKEVVSQDDLDVAQAISHAVKSHKLGSEMLMGKSEVSIVWEDPLTGLVCKARADIFSPSGGYLSDLKTTKDASRFEVSMANFHYDRQAAFYMDGFNSFGFGIDSFNFVAVETLPPYGVRAAPTQLVTIANGRAKYRAALKAISACRKTQRWPGYSSPKSWELPAWAITEVKTV